MRCVEAREQLLSYIYRDVDAETGKDLGRHIEECPDCAQELAELAAVRNLVAMSAPEAWRRKMAPKYFLVAAWVATALVAVCLGWWGHLLFHPRRLPDVPARPAEKILALLAQNMRYRSSLSQAQLLQVEEIEKCLGELGGIAEEVHGLHRIEKLARSGQVAPALEREGLFLDRYGKSPLALPVRLLLAQTLRDAGQYQDAAVRYRALLEEPSLTPHERGEYLWQQALCWRKCERSENYRSLLKELETDTIYGDFHWKAVKATADEDFANSRFVAAYGRYQKCLAAGLENLEEVEKRVRLIEVHQKDNFYPLALFVAAQHEGPQAYYGIRIILDRYPQSPLAVPAFEMYMKQEFSWTRGCDTGFPEQPTPEALLRYLAQVAEICEVNEVANFAQYRLACLLEQSEKTAEAVAVYQKLISKHPGEPLADMVKETIARLKSKAGDNL